MRVPTAAPRKADQVIERHCQRLLGRARRIIIDMDPTETHGQQQFPFFNHHYDEKADQYFVAAVLRRGNATGPLDALGILRRLIERAGNTFPKAKLRVRLDRGFASREVLDFLDCEPKVEYLVNLASNAVLNRKAKSAMKLAPAPTWPDHH